MNESLREDRQRLRIFRKYGYDIPKARNFVVRKAGIVQGRILEVGTGRGHMAVALAKNGFHFISIDLDRKAQAIARENLKVLGLKKHVVFKIMDAQKLRFKNNYFNYIISVNFIHHAKNPVQCLKEMARVAAGKLVIADLNKRGERIMRKVHSLNGRSHPPSKMSLPQAKALLEKLGFKVKAYKDVCQTVLVALKAHG